MRVVIEMNDDVLKIDSNTDIVATIGLIEAARIDARCRFAEWRKQCQMACQEKATKEATHD